jgi:hypothetical protein
MGNKKSALLSLLVVAFIVVGLVYANSQTQPTERLPTRAPQPTATRYSVVLQCSDCADIGMEINLWDSPERNKVVGSVPHGAGVFVLDSRTSSTDGRTYFRVKRGEVTGWVSSSFIDFNQ